MTLREKLGALMMVLLAIANVVLWVSLTLAVVRERDRYPRIKPWIEKAVGDDEVRCREQVMTAIDLSTKLCFYGTRRN